MAFLYLLGAKVVKIRQKRAKSSFFFYIWHVYVGFFDNLHNTASYQPAYSRQQQ